MIDHIYFSWRFCPPVTGCFVLNGPSIFLGTIRIVLWASTTSLISKSWPLLRQLVKDQWTCTLHTMRRPERCVTFVLKLSSCWLFILVYGLFIYLIIWLFILGLFNLFIYLLCALMTDFICVAGFLLFDLLLVILVVGLIVHCGRLRLSGQRSRRLLELRYLQGHPFDDEGV